MISHASGVLNMPSRQRERTGKRAANRLPAVVFVVNGRGWGGHQLLLFGWSS